MTMKPDNAMVQVLTSKLRALEVAYSLAEALQKTLRDAGLCFDGVTSVMEGVSASLADVQGALRGCDHPVEPNGLSCARCGGPGVPHRSEEVPPPDPMPGAAQAELDRQARLVAPHALDRRCGCPAECRPAAPEASPTHHEAVGFLWGMVARFEAEEGPAARRSAGILRLAAEELGSLRSALTAAQLDGSGYYVTVKLGDKTFAMVDSILWDIGGKLRLSTFTREQDAMTAGLTVRHGIAVIDARRLTHGTDL